jgi:branched-chain amino acid transport system permease protein
VEAIVLGVLSGLSFGAILFMLAAGLSLVMGVMGTLNMAHGAIYMFGAYVGWTVAIQLHLGFAPALVAAGLAGAALGLVMERGFFRRLHGRPDDQILMSFGFIYVLTTLVQVVWGALPIVPFTVPPLTGSVMLGSITYPTARVALTGIALVLALALVLFEQRTKLGAIVRAGMDDSDTARALGLQVDRASMFVFVLGSLIAGMGGFLGAPILGATTSEAVDVLLLSLVVVIVGGVGSIAGSLVGSLIIGLAVSFGATLFSGSFGYFAIYFAMILVLIFRRSGLFGRQVRSA